MTLAEHLAGGYDLYVRGSSPTWTKAQFAKELSDDGTLAIEARSRLAQIESMIRARGGNDSCHVSRIQARIIQDGLVASAALDNRNEKAAG